MRSEGDIDGHYQSVDVPDCVLRPTDFVAAPQVPVFPNTNPKASIGTMVTPPNDECQQEPPEKTPVLLELYAGIGCAQLAWPEAKSVAAIDINAVAGRVYEQNFRSTYRIQEIESIPLRELVELRASVWWLSPPCQPFSRRGNGLDSRDPRSQSLIHIIEELESARRSGEAAIECRALVLENVLGFEGSECHRRWTAALEGLDYRLQTIRVCPSELGWPNRRPRVYVIACREPLRQLSRPRYTCRWQDFLEPEPSVDSELWLESDSDKFASAMDRVDERDPKSITACFGSSYGKSLLHAGSYVQPSNRNLRLRRFSPREVANLLGFPKSFELDGLSHRQAWKLLGNGLSIPAARYALAHLPFWPPDPQLKY